MALNTTLGDPAAEAYRAIAEHKTYCTARGIAFSADDAVLEQQARLATAYMTQVYTMRWKGYRVDNAQALDWPRSFVTKPPAAVPTAYASYPAYYLTTELPGIVGDAQSELMVRVAALGTLSPDLQRGILREKVGDLDTEYDPNSAQAPRYPAVDAMLRPLLLSGNSSVSLIRA
jgi:hypothetical protein